MNAIDTLALGRAGSETIKRLARFCNIKPVGAKGILWVVKSAKSPVTNKQVFLKRSMETSDMRTAVTKAQPLVEAFLEQVRAGSATKAVTEASKINSVADLWKAYETAPTVKASKSTRKAYYSALKLILREVHGERFEADKAGMLAINRKLLKDFQGQRIAQATKEHGKNVEAIERAKRGTNAVVVQAQALFSKAACEDYGSALPACVAEFASSGLIPARAANEPEHLEDSFVQGLVAAMEDFKAFDSSVWATFQLMCWGGLRNVDCEFARVKWMTKLPSGAYQIKLEMVDDYIPKGRNSRRVIPARVGEALLANVVVREGTEPGDAHLVPGRNGQLTDRRNAIYRRLNVWLAEHGMGRESDKLAYRLRKFFFQKVEEQQSLGLAVEAHGGGDVDLVRKHYTATKPLAEIKLAQ